MKKALKYIAFCFILFFLWLPLLQYSSKFFNLKPLSGSFTKTENTLFTSNDWFSGEFQSKKEAFNNENFGFRNTLVRLNHQINFMLFNSAKASGVIIGKDLYLYEKAYIDAYYGRDFVGQEALTDYLKKLKQVQDSLEKQGKLFVFIFAPGKASFFSEYIPENLKSKPTLSNYTALIEGMKLLQINHIDFNDYFKKQKAISKYPLYPQYGIHWSNYGSSVVFDSLLSYVEKKTGKNLPDIEKIEYQHPDTLITPDEDLISGMNLLWYPKTYSMVYPLIYYKYDSLVNTKLNSLMVGDSYWWVIYNRGWQKNFFKMGDFWYYNKKVYPDFALNENLYTNRINYLKRLKSMDVIMIVNTEATLSKLNYGFADMCYETFCQKTDSLKEALLDIKQHITLDQKWFNNIKEKAKKENLTVDSMLTLDAQWIYNERSKKTK